MLNFPGRLGCLKYCQILPPPSLHNRSLPLHRFLSDFKNIIMHKYQDFSRAAFSNYNKKLDITNCDLELPTRHHSYLCLIVLVFRPRVWHTLRR